MTKLYIRNFNGILDDLLKTEEFEIVDEPREADVFVLWQDVRSDMLELCLINKEFLHKPVVVVQHGRGCTRDYLSPNNFKLLADKFCCWGQKEYDRLVKAGYKDKAVITGSPLIKRLRPKENHDGKNIIFIPVITQHEEPENILAYWELKRIELKKSKEKIEKFREQLKDTWQSWVIKRDSSALDSIPYHIINMDWRLIAKLTGVHDKRLYMGDVIISYQNNQEHINNCTKILTMMDCVVGVEEGTFQLLAMAMDIPIIMVEGFKYKQYGGIDYSNVEVIKTEGVTWCNINELEKVIDSELENPSRLKDQRKQVVEDELGDLKSDPIQNIIKVIKEVT